jgi:NAD(P)H-hydrate epimerase
MYRKGLAGMTYSSVVVGPGLGMRPEGKRLLEELLTNYPGPLVVDADALNIIAEYRLHPLLVRRKGMTVLTPHPGEMARLLDVSKDEVVQDPSRALRQAVEMTHSTVMLKGAATLVSSPDDVLYLNHYPNDGMATAGSGDVLAGMIGGLLGQGMAPFQGTLLAIYLHSLAGDFAAQSLGHRSMTAPDIIENISNAFKDIKGRHEQVLPLEGRAWLL